MTPITVGIVAVKGGPGSGNWGHAGRPGLVGGSSVVGVPIMDMENPHVFGHPSFANMKLVGGVWLEGAKAFEQESILMRLLTGEVVQ